MKTELTGDELKTLICSLSGDLTKLAADKRIIHQKLGEDFDEMYDALMKKIERLQEKLYGALTTLEDQER